MSIPGDDRTNVLASGIYAQRRERECISPAQPDRSDTDAAASFISPQGLIWTDRRRLAKRRRPRFAHNSSRGPYAAIASSQPNRGRPTPVRKTPSHGMNQCGMIRISKREQSFTTR